MLKVRMSAASLRRIMIGAVLLIGGMDIALAGDKLTEANMTQRDYNNITAQESSVQGQPPAVPPTPVHNLTPADEQAITAAGGTKLISGKDWKHESPQERDAHLRRMDSTLPDGSTYIISVPKGDVWLIPASESQDGFGASQKLQDLEARNIVRPWTDAEREALPKAVARDKAVSQSDKHGTTREKPVKKEKKP